MFAAAFRKKQLHSAGGQSRSPLQRRFCGALKGGSHEKITQNPAGTCSLAAAAAVIVISNLPTAKTQEAVGELLRKKLDLPQDAVITCAGDYTADAYTLLWFIIQNQNMTLYRAVDCRVLNNGSYWMKKTYTPSAYARDIVHVVWRYARDIILINNFDCRSIVYHTSYGDEKTELSAEDIPYVFPYALPFGTTDCDFLDAAGNSIR